MKNLTLKFVLTFVLGLGLAFAAEAQTLKGVVKDATGEPVIGAAVVVEGTTLGVSTGVDGSFTLNLPDAKNNVLLVSYIGMKEARVAVVGKTSVEVTLEEDATGIEDVVVVGYGVMKKSDLTGSVGSVAAEDIAARGTVRLEEALQGSVPGVNITQSNSRAGGSFSMQIRGQSSITKSNDPLYVIDGIVSSSMDFLNPEDIERVDVLKDASSTAISTHVGIVRYECNGIVYTIEGNNADEVRLDCYDLKDTFIVGYATPEYSRREDTAIDYLLDEYTEGNYIIAAVDLPVRSRPNGGRVTFTLHRGDLMHIYECVDGWGRTDYGWIPMTDTQPIDVR